MLKLTGVIHFLLIKEIFRKVQKNSKQKLNLFTVFVNLGKIPWPMMISVLIHTPWIKSSEWKTIGKIPDDNYTHVLVILIIYVILFKQSQQKRKKFTFAHFYYLTVRKKEEIKTFFFYWFHGMTNVGNDDG